uniref:GAG-pre-integrase domain-containing protein n=1 Tax=Tanacetum cinerariifolium TaxID=118510 RepID=A0A699HRE4_TANCI|nr:hypothetical protein [Tanacetum cinerariifolium]
MILALDNCHFSHSITRGVISLSCLWDNGAISVSKDNIFYFNSIPRDGIFKIDMHNHVSNECSIYTCSNKKSKHNLDSTFLWHYHLGHINKKCIAKLQHDGLLKSIDDESFDVCVSCISGKMARKPFTHASERVMIYLESYRVMYMDHFGPRLEKTFPNEVENQLGKTIKSLQSDQGGEYLSQEFLDHLRSRGIISQLTPPYTPQYNGLCSRVYCMHNQYGSNKQGYPKETTSYYFYCPLENKNFVARYAEFFKNNLMSQEESGSIVSARIPQAPERYGFYIYAEEHELGDHGGHLNYRAALSDLEFEKWIEAMNAEMQSMKDIQV